MFMGQRKVLAVLFCGMCTSMPAQSRHRPTETSAIASAQLSQSLDRARQLDRKFLLVASELKEAEAKLEEAKRQDAIVSQAETLRQSLVKAQLDLSLLRVRFTEEYPGVIRAKQKVAEQQTSYDQFLARGGATGNLTVVEITRTIDALRLEQVQLQEELDRNREETASLLMKYNIPDNNRLKNHARKGIYSPSSGGVIRFNSR